MPCDYFCKPSFNYAEIMPLGSPWGKENPDVAPMNPQVPPHECTRTHRPHLPSDFQYASRPVIFKPPSHHHMLLLQVAPRPSPTILGTLHYLRKAGSLFWPGFKTVCCDGQVDDSIVAAARTMSADRWYLYPGAAEQVGSARSLIRSLRIALEIDPGLDRVTILEDDVVSCSHALSYLAHVAVPPDVAFLTWFTYDYDFSWPPHPAQSPHPHDLPPPVLACRPSRYFIFSQVVTLPRRTVDLLLSCPHVTDHWHKTSGRDNMLAWALGDAPYASHFPVLFQHVGGTNSAVVMQQGKTQASPGDPHYGSRTSNYFVGPDFDPFTLVPNHLRS